MNPLLADLLTPEAYPHPAPAPRLIETHISWVILAGDFAYKIKKPVDFGFLDFSTLGKREHCCREEIRLNRRLAPATYLDVVAIAGHPAKIEGSGPVLEWAVRMRAFPAESTLDREETITSGQIDAIADQVARFHGEIAVAGVDDEYGTAAAVRAPAERNFANLRPLLAADLAQLDRLQAWTDAEGRRLEAHFIARKRAGFIRECHGDLHLGNIAWVDEAPLIFDGIEFNPGLRFIDVISEVAFLVMDLLHRGHAVLAWRFLNRYLETTGDYAGLTALPYYLVYRALVRAKVAAIRDYQAGGDHQAGGDFAECRSYLLLAERLTQLHKPALILMHGVSGSGKTWVSQHLLERLGAIRLRSDVERKRLFGLAPLDRSEGLDIYSREAGGRTLAHLLDLTQGLLRAGFTVILDATFIRRDWRDPCVALAQTQAVPWLIAAVSAEPESLRQRVRQRQIAAADASEAGLEVLESQLQNLEPFSPEELAHVIHLDGDVDASVRRIGDHLP